MSRSTYFVQECPTCGRNLQIRVQYLGKQVVCQHCSARFEAFDSSSGAIPPPSSSLSVLARAEELLQSTAASGIGVPNYAAGIMPMRPK
jgi:DNA-directed RNA polymerase subunit RPC12/RpoP